MVGSSMMMSGSGCGFSSSAMVSPMVMPLTPATATMSPTAVSLMSVRFSPLKVKSLVILVFCSEPSRLEMLTSSPVLQCAVEDAADGEAAEVVGVIEIGDQDLQRAVRRRRGPAGSVVTMVSKSGCRSVPGVSRESDGGALLGVGVEHGEIELVLRRRRDR